MNRAVLAVVVGLIVAVCVGDISAGYAGIGVAPNYGTRQWLDSERMILTQVNDAGRSAGLRTGDILDMRRLSIRDRMYIRLGYAHAGTVFDCTFLRGGAAFTVREVFAAQPNRGLQDGLDIFLRVLMVASGLLLIARGSDWGSLAAGFGLCAFAVYEGFGLFYPGPLWFALLLQPFNFLSGLASYAGRFLLGIYLLPHDTPRWIRSGISVLFGGLFAAYTFFALTRLTLLFFGTTLLPIPWGFYSGTQVLVSVTVVALFAYVAASARGPQAGTMRVLFAALLISSIGGMINLTYAALGLPSPFDGAFNLAWLAVAFAFPYALLGKRLVAIDFVVSKAAIYAIVLAVVVGVFILAEQLIERAALSRMQSFAFELLVPLVLGFSIKWIEKLAEHLVETVLYRDKLRAERELDALIDDFPHARDVRILAGRVASEIHRNMRAPFVVVYREAGGSYTPVASAGHGQALPVSADDPVFIRLRSKRQPVYAEDFATALPRNGAVFPLVVFGTVTGAMYCHFRESGERFDPDEVQTLSKVCHELAIALLWVERDSAPAPALGQAAPLG